MRISILAVVLSVVAVPALMQGAAPGPLEGRDHGALAPSAPVPAYAGPSAPIELAGDNVCNPRVQVCES